MRITYLDHSGFVVEGREQILVFDYYQDPAGYMAKVLAGPKPLRVFVSHRHGDHFVPDIFSWGDRERVAYIVSDDVLLEKAKGDRKVVSLAPYKTWQSMEGDLRVCTYGSTDEGVSFLVKMEGISLFHAGDLNWWHWTGETKAEQRLAEEKFQREKAHLEGVKTDILFFPVDARQGECRTWGVEQILPVMQPKLLVPMHACGEIWQPDGGFQAKWPAMELFIPQKSGDSVEFGK